MKIKFSAIFKHSSILVETFAKINFMRIQFAKNVPNLTRIIYYIYKKRKLCLGLAKEFV